MTGADGRSRGWAREFGAARWTIVGFVLVTLATAAFLGIDMGELAEKSLWRVAMNLVLCLSLVPMIRGGTGLNFGLPLGVVAGLLAMVIVLNADMTGFTAFSTAVVLAVVLAVPIGILYGATLNAVRGNEMMVGIYLGWAFVSLFCVFWLVAPFHSPKLVWAIGGKGLRTTLELSESFGGVLDAALSRVERVFFGTFRPRLGLLLFSGLLFALVGLFFRTRYGLMIRASGENPRFAAASGIRVNRTRIVAVTMSTVLAAIGAIVYAQSYGFAQLYAAPLMMALPAVAAVLIGGATIHRITLGNVVVGVLLFQTILTLAPPTLAEGLHGGDITESLRLTIQNGMILYALTRREARA